MKFTDKSIAALRPKAARYEVWEGDGFGVRVSPRGIKSWVWMYRFEGRARRVTLGTYPTMGLADAHIALGEAKKTLLAGVDPGAAKVEENRRERIAETVAELIEDYLEKWAMPRKRSAGEDRRILNKDVLPAWGRRKAKDIARRDVIALLDDIVGRGAPIQANRTFAVIRKMFSWAVSRDIVPANPCNDVGAPAKDNHRDVWLDAKQIKSLWAGLSSPDVEMSHQIALALKFQLATAQRKGEVIAAEWSEFDTEGEKVWTIPKERAKNGLAHRVPLSSLALSLLDEIRAAEKDRVARINKRRAKAGLPDIEPSRWLFPSPSVSRDAPITAPAVDHAFRDNLKVFGFSNVTPHDLRRTAASHMTLNGVSRLVVGKILNHVEAGVTAVYDRHSYDPEKRFALDAWGKLLMEMATGEAAGSNVAPFAKKTA